MNRPLSPAAEAAALKRRLAAHRRWLKRHDRRVAGLKTPDTLPQETR